MEMPDPQLIFQHLNGHWGAITLATAIEHSIFTRIEHGTTTCAALAEAASLSSRGTQALLDGLVGLGFLTLSEGRYANTAAATFFLVEGKPAYMGAWASRLLGPHGDLAQWVQLPEVVKRGGPEHRIGGEDKTFWEQLVRALAPGTWPVAQQVAARLDFAALGAARLLDVGGGAGVYSAVFLLANPKGRSTQVDWAHVNRIARDYVGQFGVGDRFETRDGDFHDTDLGEAIYDLAVYSHIAHGESPADNVTVMRRLKRALKPNGTLVVVDFVVKDDRSGPPFALLFHLMMLLVTREGATWRESDYRGWLAEAGFASITIEETPTAASLILAR
jgi:ubiquinone/menaquinone biosynthesis C-methylase UbiE